MALVKVPCTSHTSSCIHEVLYIPDFARNLFLVSASIARRNIFHGNGDTLTINTLTRETIIQEQRINKLYFVFGSIAPTEHTNATMELPINVLVNNIDG